MYEQMEVHPNYRLYYYIKLSSSSMLNRAWLPRLISLGLSRSGNFGKSKKYFLEDKTALGNNELFLKIESELGEPLAR